MKENREDLAEKVFWESEENLDEELSKTRKLKSIDTKACILAHNIFEIALEKHKNDNN